MPPPSYVFLDIPLTPLYGYCSTAHSLLVWTVEAALFGPVIGSFDLPLYLMDQFPDRADQFSGLPSPPHTPTPGSVRFAWVVLRRHPNGRVCV